MLPYQAICKYNDFYGSTEASEHELDKGYTPPVYKRLLFSLPESVWKGYDELIAVQNLNKSFCIKATNKKVSNIGHLDRVYRKRIDKIWEMV